MGDPALHRPELPLKFMVPLAFVLASTVVQAQPIAVLDRFTILDPFFLNGTPGTYQGNLGQSHQVDGALYSFSMRGDVTAQMRGTADYFGFSATASFILTTGAAPVQLTDITVEYNGKEVLSGGSLANYSAQISYRAGLNVPGFGQDFEIRESVAPRVAQGVYIEDRLSLAPGTIMAANTEYQLYMLIFADLNAANFLSPSSMLGYAVEFGGTVAPWLDGMTVSFVATPVSEPASLWLLGLGVAAVVARRRAMR